MYVKLSEMRHRVTILRPQKIIDDEGNIIEEERQILKTVWAKVLPVAAKIADGYIEKAQEVTYRIIVRYGVDVQVTDFLLWEGKLLVQTAPPYFLDGLKKYLVLETKEFLEDG